MGAQLSKGLYMRESNPTSTLFGLCCGQTRDKDGQIVFKGWWYNKDGERLGWGDLSIDDFERIKSELNDGEFFIVLKDNDRRWNLAIKKSQDELDIEAPGIDYVAENCRFVITSGQSYIIEESGEDLGTQDTYTHYSKKENIESVILSKKGVKDLITV